MIQSDGKSQVQDIETLRDIVRSSPYAKHMGMELIEAGDGIAKVRMKAAHCLENTQGIIHGGAICSLADQAGLIAVATRLRPEQRPRTVQMDTHYLAPASGETLTAVGQVSKKGSLISISDVEIMDDKGKVVAIARCTSVVVEFNK